MVKSHLGNDGILLKHSKISIIVIYNLGTLLGLAVFYPLIPILMGYPQEVMELSGKVGISYALQYFVIGILAVVIGTLCLTFLLKGIGKWQNAIEENDFQRLGIIREKCISMPYTIYVLQVLVIGTSLPILLGIVSFMNRTPISQFVKISIVVFSYCSLAAVFSHIFSKRLFVKILLKTYNGEGLQGKRIGIIRKIFIQMVPVFTVAILFTSVLAYARMVEEKGNLTYRICKLQLADILAEKSEYKSTDELFEALNRAKIEDTKIGFFSVNKTSGNITMSDGYVPGVYFEYLANNPVQGDRVYGDSFEMQGVIANVRINGEDCYAGIRFENTSEKTMNYFILTFITLIFLNIFVLYYFSKSIKDEISLVAESLTEIAEGEYVDLDTKLAVVSNDELGDLVIAFNKIQEKEKEYLREREEQQTILFEQERLASLGQLIGGIAHNLRTPIMSLSGAIEGLKDLVNEYDTSIEDDTVTIEDHHLIAKDMLNWLEKMKPYCSYMSDIITAVKEQTIHRSNEKGLYFTIDELASRVEILMNHELKRFHCKIECSFQIGLNTKIRGDISVLVQVLNNLIINGIQAYEGKGGVIEFKVAEEVHKIHIIVKDYGKGIPKEVQDKLFKEMITTKGKNGTGLGLYMSNSNIRARFGGVMKFESEENVGTTFHIILPYTHF